MTIPDMGYAIVSKYNVVLVCLSLKQNITIFPLRSRPPSSNHSHRIICIGHVYGTYYNDLNNAKKFNIYRYINMNVNYFQVKLRDGSPLPTEDMLWSKYCYPEARL